jgi:hypothetical protein
MFFSQIGANSIAPPGQEGWREAPGWLFLIEEFCLSNLIHHPVCAFGAATPPGQEGRSLKIV